LLREAVSRQSTNVAALELMAEAAVRTGRWQDAEFALKSALGLQPDNLNLQLRLGGVYLSRNDTSAARDVFRELTESYPHSDRAWASLGLLDAMLGNEERALVELDQALKENPLLPEVQLAYGELLLRQGRDAEALAAFQAARNLLPDRPPARRPHRQARSVRARCRRACASANAIDGGFRPVRRPARLGDDLIRDGLCVRPSARSSRHSAGSARRSGHRAGAAARAPWVLRRGRDRPPSRRSTAASDAAAQPPRGRGLPTAALRWRGRAAPARRRAQPADATRQPNLERAEVGARRWAARGRAESATAAGES
jgi:tetratricopeptide (TPR) repeat protein